MSSWVPGLATPEGTARYAERMRDHVADGHFRSALGKRVSSIGIGTYLGAEDAVTDAMYQGAILRALELGANVVDTAINYRSQRSERAVGEALRRAFAEGHLARDEVVVASKGGFVPFDGNRPRSPRQYFEDTYVKPGLFRWSDLAAGCHCLTPAYLKDQIARSLRNLGLSSVDIYFLHNPETQLAAVARGEFLARVRAAFATLEEACAAGSIGAYGTATWNGYREPRTAMGHLSLDELLGAAREAGGDAHHFHVLQLPLNLGMREALLAPTQEAGGRRVPLLQAAAARGMYVMTSSSIGQGQLADPARALQLVRSAPGVGTALVGMKLSKHVEANLALARVPPLPAEEARRLLAALEP